MNKKTEKVAKEAYLRVDIVNILAQGAKYSAEQDAGGFGTVIGAQLAGELLEKIARRAWAIGDDELKCHCYRLGLVEKSDQLEEWFDRTMRKLKEGGAK